MIQGRFDDLINNTVVEREKQEFERLLPLEMREEAEQYKETHTRIEKLERARER